MCNNIVSLLTQLNTLDQEPATGITNSWSSSAPCSPAATSSGYSSCEVSPGPMSTATLECGPSYNSFQKFEMTSSFRPDHSFGVTNSYCSSPYFENESFNIDSPEYCSQAYVDDLRFPTVATEPNPSFPAHPQHTLGPENLPDNKENCSVVYGPNLSFSNHPQSVETVAHLLKQCKICGDMASGNHFGVQSCEACKSFFRRSICSNSHYACRGNRTCTIEKGTRNRCQYCRLQKCLINGMRKEAVRGKRNRFTAKIQPTTGSLENMMVSNESRVKVERLKCTADSFVSDAHTVLLNAEKGLQSNQSALVTSLNINSDLENSLLMVINWAKQIPAFVCLSREDQLTLLNSCWHEVFILMQASQDSTSTSNELVHWISNLGADKVELACLKGVLLFNQDTKGLSLASKKRVEVFQEQILQSLETHTKTVYGGSPLRFSKLLLKLGSLKSISAEVLRKLNVQEILGNGKVITLLKELLC